MNVLYCSHLQQLSRWCQPLVCYYNKQVEVLQYDRWTNVLCKISYVYKNVVVIPSHRCSPCNEECHNAIGCRKTKYSKYLCVPSVCVFQVSVCSKCLCVPSVCVFQVSVCSKCLCVSSVCVFQVSVCSRS